MIAPFHKGELLNGRYRILELINAGGEAWVHRAEDKQDGGLVAIRQYQRNGPEERHRWGRECNLHLRSDHVIQHHGGGEVNGSMYVVVEYFDGTGLDEYLVEAGSYLPGDEPISVTRQVAHGLADMHTAGMVHRDIKTPNVLINRDTKLVKIIDLGLVHFRRGPTIANDGLARGTLHYMSPEQLTDPTSVGPQSDLYSLGVVLYEMSTGTLPFDGANCAEVQRKILQEQPLSPRILRPDISTDDEAIILKLLAKAPSARFQSAGSLLFHLDGQGSGAVCPACQGPCADGALYCPSCGVEISVAASAPALLCLDTDRGHRWLVIGPDGILLGRALLDPGNPAISMAHARIFRRGNGWYVEDMGSTNGTRVDGRRANGQVRLSKRSFLQYADMGCMFWSTSL